MLQPQDSHDEGIVLIELAIPQLPKADQNVDDELQKDRRRSEGLPFIKMPKALEQAGSKSNEGEDFLKEDQPRE